MTTYYQDAHVTLHHGDALGVLTDLPDRSVDCIVTSPPYFGLRDYGVDGQIGAEPSPGEFVAALVAVFREARRVLADDGTLWLNLGDSYVHKKASGPQGRDGERATRTFTADAAGGWSGLPDKNLLGIPWRVALALQDDGWTLRNEIIWHKPNAMPESVADRLSNRHEHLFLLTKQPRYWFDLDPIREPRSEVSIKRATPHRSPAGKAAREGLPYAGIASPQTLALSQMMHDGGRNPGDVWTIATQPFTEAHFATMPPALAERCIQAGCKPGGTVLDLFSGSGTTGLAAARHGRRYVGIDLNADYLDLSLRTRLAQPSLTTEASA